MKKIIVLFLLMIITLISCNSGEVVEGVPYEGKDVVEISLHQNWQTPFLKLNTVRGVSSLRRTKIINDNETMVKLINIIEKTIETNSFEVHLRSSQYDLILKFDDNTTKVFHLEVNKEGEKGLFVDNSASPNAFRIPVEENKQLQEIIESPNNN